MAVSIDGSAPALLGKLPTSIEPASEAGQPEDFAHLYQLAAHAELGERPWLAADKVTGEEDEASAKKLADEQAVAALLLFLFSQQLPSSPPPADIGADKGEELADAAMDENNHALSLDTVAVTDEFPEVDNRAETSIKPATYSVEQNADENKQADQDPAAQPVKTPSAAPTAELPIRPADKRRAAPLSENTAAPRSLLQGSHSPSASTLAALPPDQTQALPLRSGQFSELLSQRVMWLSSQNLQAAQIELSPKELGTLQVHVALEAGQAEVHFASQHAEVRGVLEGQLYRLQAMLENQGLPTPRLGIFDSSQTEHKEQNGRQSRRSKSPVLESEESAVIQPVSRQTLIDYYA